MGSMAIHADRHFIWLFFPQLTPNDLLMHLLDKTVALLAGLGHIISIDGGFGVSVGQDIMRSMTIGADGSDGQTFVK